MTDSFLSENQVYLDFFLFLFYLFLIRKCKFHNEAVWIMWGWDFIKSKSECMDLCIPFFSVCIDSRWYEICFLFCLYYTLNLDPFLPREFTNVKQLPIHFISFQRLFSSNKTQQQIWSSEKNVKRKKYVSYKHHDKRKD